MHLVIHYDPVVTDDEELSELRDTVLQLLQTQDARISVHDFRMVRGEGHTNLIFDIVLPSDLMPNKKQIKKQLDEDLNRDAQTQFYTVVTFDMSTFNA